MAAGCDAAALRDPERFSRRQTVQVWAPVPGRSCSSLLPQSNPPETRDTFTSSQQLRQAERRCWVAHRGAAEDGRVGSAGAADAACWSDFARAEKDLWVFHSKVQTLADDFQTCRCLRFLQEDEDGCQGAPGGL